jgi:hypothetical protein
MKKYKVEFDLFLVGDDTKWVAPAIYNILDTDKGEDYYNFICKSVESSEEGLHQYNFTMELHIGDDEPSPSNWLSTVLSDNLGEFEYEYNQIVVEIE